MSRNHSRTPLRLFDFQMRYLVRCVTKKCRRAVYAMRSVKLENQKCPRCKKTLKGASQTTWTDDD